MTSVGREIDTLVVNYHAITCNHVRARDPIWLGFRYRHLGGRLSCHHMLAPVIWYRQDFDTDTLGGRLPWQLAASTHDLV